MSTITVIDKRQETGQEPADWIPIGHIAELAWLMSDRATRPTRALCGAEILGIPANTEHVKCEDCHEALMTLTDSQYDAVVNR